MVGIATVKVVVVLMVSSWMIQNGDCEVTLAEFFPYGEANGDTLIPGESKDVALQTPIKLFGQTLATIKVIEDGILSTKFNNFASHCGKAPTAGPTISIFWADANENART